MPLLDIKACGNSEVPLRLSGDNLTSSGERIKEDIKLSEYQIPHSGSNRAAQHKSQFIDQPPSNPALYRGTPLNANVQDANVQDPNLENDIIVRPLCAESNNQAQRSRLLSFAAPPAVPSSSLIPLETLRRAQSFIVILQTTQHGAARHVLDIHADQLLQFASPTFLDKAMDIRLQDISASDLVAVLKRNKRLSVDYSSLDGGRESIMPLGATAPALENKAPQPFQPHVPGHLTQHHAESPTHQDLARSPKASQNTQVQQAQYPPHSQHFRNSQHNQESQDLQIMSGFTNSHKTVHGRPVDEGRDGTARMEIAIKRGRDEINESLEMKRCRTWIMPEQPGFAAPNDRLSVTTRIASNNQAHDSSSNHPMSLRSRSNVAAPSKDIL